MTLMDLFLISSAFAMVAAGFALLMIGIAIVRAK